MRTFGFPDMDLVKGVRRGYPPDLIHAIAKYPDTRIIIEEGYGEDIGFSEKDYLVDNVEVLNKADLFSESDYIVAITTLSAREIEMLQPGQCLLAFLHYNTHESRNRQFFEKGVKTISLDEAKEPSTGRRMVEDLKATSFNAIKAGLIALRESWGDEKWFSKDRDEIKAFVMGTGMVGRNAIDALSNFQYTGLRQELIDRGNPKIIVEVLGMYETPDKEFINRQVMPHADLLVDASYRPEGVNQNHIIDQTQLELMKEDSVIVDITADKYDLTGEVPVVKGIEGVPTGKDKDYKLPRFKKDSPEFTDTDYVPDQYQLNPNQRRTVVSSYSWPSYGTNKDRLANVEIYSRQVRPILEFLAQNGYEGIREPEELKTSSMNDALYGAINPLERA